MLRSSFAHLQQAERIEAFLKVLPPGHPYREWVVIAWFYSALHYVEAFLVTKSAAYRDHDLRRSEMRRHAETTRVVVAYHQLHKAAKEARYDGTPFTQKDLDELEPMFLQVKSTMRQALGL